MHPSTSSKPRKGGGAKRKIEEIDDHEEGTSSSSSSSQCGQSSKTQKLEGRARHDYAKIQWIFTKPMKDVQVQKAELERIQELIKKKYPEVRDAFDDYANKETADKLKKWVATPRKPNIFRRNLENAVGTIKKVPTTFPSNDTPFAKSGVTLIKPDRNSAGEHEIHTDCARIETGDVMNRMMYWVAMEQTIVTRDQLRLSHMPHFEKLDQTNQMAKNLYSELNAKFDDGIHGCRANHDYMNNWMFYKLFRLVLPEFEGNPDILYYAFYRLFPNNFSQRELSEKFPSWCALFADPHFNFKALEPWKKEEVLGELAALNLRNVECYACLEMMCPVHGFVPQIPPEFPGGDFVEVDLLLPNANDTSERCSDKCWKSIPYTECQGILNFADGAETARIVLDKLEILKMSEPEGAMLAAWYLTSHNIPFCEFAGDACDPDDEYDKEMHTCAGAYRLVMRLNANVSPERLELGRGSVKKSRQDRVNAFRSNQKKRANSIREKRHEELRKEAFEKRIDVNILIAQDEQNEKSNEKVQLSAVTEIMACRHAGPCATDEDCVCRENGVCSYACRCDVNCPQRFPGCNCGAGQCQSKACQCYRANWECNPLTCRNCKCDNFTTDEIKCKNFAMSRMAQKRMQVAPSKIAGNGLFILEEAEKDEFITEYVGERITDEEVERRGTIYDKLQCSYIFNLHIGGAIDSFSLGNMSRFANHDDKNPSIYAKSVVVSGEHRIGFYAKRALQPGDELTFDYSYSREHQVAIGVKNADGTKSKGAKRTVNQKKPNESDE